MALSQSRANTILRKLGLPTIRPANHFEETVDTYGVKYRWALDRGDYQSSTLAPTIHALVAKILQDHWDSFDSDKLTEKELQELRAIPSQVARYI